MVYKTFPASTPTLHKGDGDGTVNIRSLLGCTRWEGQQKQAIHHHVFPKVDHIGILKQDETAEYVKNVVQTIVAETYHENEVLPNIDIVI